jgi:hypothetical protein
MELAGERGSMTTTATVIAMLLFLTVDVCLLAAWINNRSEPPKSE